MSRVAGKFRIGYIGDNDFNENQFSILIQEERTNAAGSLYWGPAMQFMNGWKVQRSGGEKTPIWAYLQLMDCAQGDLIDGGFDYAYNSDTPTKGKHKGRTFHNYMLTGIDGLKKQPNGPDGVRERTETAKENDADVVIGSK